MITCGQNWNSLVNMICNKTLCRCGPCSKALPKSFVNDDFNAYEGNVPATLFLDLDVAISVSFALFPRRLVGHNTAGSHVVPIRARQVLFSLH
jgi:hypothetical protein